MQQIFDFNQCENNQYVDTLGWLQNDAGDKERDKESTAIIFLTKFSSREYGNK